VLADRESHTAAFDRFVAFGESGPSLRASPLCAPASDRALTRSGATAGPAM